MSPGASAIVAAELFGCSGGMAEGFRRAGIEFIASFDVDPDACESYARNLRRRPIRMDARDLRRLADLGAQAWTLDLLVADPPCTPWSRAGKRLGLEDERDMLGETARLIDMWRPRCWLIGNVPGLDDAPNANVLQSVLRPLSHHYCIDYVSLDAAAYGVAQHRVRPFWFGHPLRTSCIRWPSPTHGGLRNQLQIEGTELEPYITVRQALAHLNPNELGTAIRVKVGHTRHDHPLSELDRPAGTILAGQPSNCGNVLAPGRVGHRPTHMLAQNVHSDGALLLMNPKHPISEPDVPSRTICARDRGGAQGGNALHWPWDRPSTTLTTRDEVAQCARSGKAGTSQSTNAIKLSERAAAILQGFPEDWRFAGKTKRARWSQIGQAMPPPMAAAIARSIRTWLDATQRNAPSCERAAVV